MRKVLLVLLGLMLLLSAFSQHSFYFKKISETEISTYYDKTTVYGKQKNIYNTVEDYLHAFEQEYGTNELHNVLNAIEKGNVIEYINVLKDKGLVEESDDVNSIKTALDERKLCFISKGKIYVLTYEPINLNVKNAKSGNSETVTITEKNLYLYRRDDNGWRKASDLIRKDFNHNGNAAREFDPHTSHFNENTGHFSLENIGFGSINRISNGCVFITFKTTEWNPKFSYCSYNCILVFVPKGDETYKCSYFEPLNKEGKVIKNFPLDEYDWVKQVWNKRITDIRLPDLYGVRSIEYNNRMDGLSIKYWDGTTDNPILAGTLNFTIRNGQVFNSGSIGLNNYVYKDTIRNRADIQQKGTSEIMQKEIEKLKFKKTVQTFGDDNVSLEMASSLKKQFLDGKNQIQYSSYSNHTYTLDFNSPYLDEKRGFEPTNIEKGIQRAYFINSESVCIQRQVINFIVTEEIYFHPNGKIYSIIKIENGKKNGYAKFVDLDNYVFLDGNFRNDNLIGFWNTPTMSNFNMQSKSLSNQYPGVVNSAITFISFYRMNSDSRKFSMN